MPFQAASRPILLPSLGRKLSATVAQCGRLFGVSVWRHPGVVVFANVVNSKHVGFGVESLVTHFVVDLAIPFRKL